MAEQMNRTILSFFIFQAHLRSSSPNDNCQLHLKTRFHRLKTCFHCHSVFVVHTNTPGRRSENLNDTQFGYFGHLKTSNDGVTS
jgi:hypothetical protein